MAQTHVNRTYPEGVEGDFASVNPTATALSTLDGALRAGTDGLKAARFGWIEDTTGTVSNKGTGTPDGFIRREGYGTPIGAYDHATMIFLPGHEVAVYAVGDFWARLLESSAPAVRGVVVYASTTDGTIAAATGADAPEGTVATRFHFASAAQPGELVKIAAFGGV